MLMFGRNQHNIVKQLFFNKNINTFAQNTYMYAMNYYSAIKEKWNYAICSNKFT